MLYASTRSSLTKALGSAPFTDSVFATSKADLTPDAYAKHRASLAAPKPMSAREKEMEEIRAAESTSATYDGSRARTNHVTKEIGLGWPEDVENAVKELGYGEESKVVVIVSLSARMRSYTLTGRTRQLTQLQNSYSWHLQKKFPPTTSVLHCPALNQVGSIK